MSKLKTSKYQDKKAGKGGHSKSVTYSVIINPVLSFRVSIAIYQIKNKSTRTTKKCQTLLSKPLVFFVSKMELVMCLLQ